MATKGSYKSEEEKEAWMGVVNYALMSSESSGEEEGEEVIIVHPLPWISSEVGTFKKKLDNEIAKEKSPQGRRQMKRRVFGSASSRPRPLNPDLPSWALVE